MKLEQLRYFCEAARFQHVGKAAKFVHISPSAISAAVASLEESLECRLFERRGKSIVLTESGQSLKEEAERLFEQVNLIKGRLNQKTRSLRGEFRIGGSHFLASHVLTPAWTQLQNRYPELTGEIRPLHTAIALKEVVVGGLDMALCFSPVQHPELTQNKISQGRLVVAVRKGHPILKSKGRKAVSQLSGYPAVIHKGRSGVELCEAHPIFARYGITPNIRLAFESDTCAVEAVVASDCWTLIPDCVARHHAKQIQVISHPSDWNADYNIALVCRLERENSPVLNALKVQLGA